MAAPLQIEEVAAVRQWVRDAQSAGARVGFVPTMGALHAGHTSLVDRARRECDRVVVSLFVNPTQFSPNEDYERYPRPLEDDLRRLEAAGADAVLLPAVEAIYPPGDATTVDVGSVAMPWEGASRPTHFRGVATVVTKLFGAVPADRAYFGRKDYQQTVVVRRLVTDLLLPIEIVVCPTVREPDGLAMSSRNAYLSPRERQQALAVPESLEIVERLVTQGERRVEPLRAAALERLDSAEGMEPDYVAFMADGTVEEVEHLTGPTVVAVAARVGRTRLIDNRLLA
ncbi:Pantoate-beta-alanine ligase [Botrimarina hoheduenensis]|uniref:Pantothenate synthetase n=2 Tax=Botrimarina hoheduenensis TaxID=2528000 RepID=A0A5C5W955_9BACT|nr:Pantoate-beta-alanine ligase [Botrimarina hoheduenensis]